MIINSQSIHARHREYLTADYSVKKWGNIYTEICSADHYDKLHIRKDMTYCIDRKQSAVYNPFIYFIVTLL